MDQNSILLNARLTSASKKFYKSCEQIKAIKQRISELVNMFTYCDQEINRLSQQINNTDPKSRDDENEKEDARSRSHLCVFRESIRQQIENLQCVKAAYFMYAHRKSDEITKLQCELYGEDAVRAAYERDGAVNEDENSRDQVEAETNPESVTTSNWTVANNQVFESYLTA